MKLVVGLGNPGRKYVATRHNVGFDVVRAVSEKFGGTAPRVRFEAEVVELTIEGERVLLMAPQTYMNCSGRSVRAAVDFYKLTESDILVVCDDFSLDLARLRFRAKGSSGGQKGLQDIIRHLGTQEFARLRLGIGSPPPNWEVAAFVLSKFGGEDREEMDAAVKRAANGVKTWVEHGVQQCMNEYNGK